MKTIMRMAIILLFVLAGCGEEAPRAEQQQMKIRESVQIVQRYVDEILNKGSLAVADEIIGKDFVDPAAGAGEKGPESLKKVIASFRSVFPDLIVTIDTSVVSGDKIAWKWTAAGTHRAVMFGIPPTNKPVTFGGIIIDTVRDGKIVRRQGVWDRLGLKEQLMKK